MATESLFKLKLDSSQYVQGMRAASAATNDFDRATARSGNGFEGRLKRIGAGAQTEFRRLSQASRDGAQGVDVLARKLLTLEVGRRVLTALWERMRTGATEGGEAIRRLDGTWDKFAQTLADAASEGLAPAANELARTLGTLNEMPGALSAATSGLLPLKLALDGLGDALRLINSFLPNSSTEARWVPGPQNVGLTPGAVTPVGVDPSQLGGNFYRGTGYRRRQGAWESRGGGGGGGGGEAPEGFNFMAIEREQADSMRSAEEQRLDQRRRDNEAAEDEQSRHNAELQYIREKDIAGQLAYQDKEKQIAARRRELQQRENAEMLAGAKTYAGIVFEFAQGLAGSKAEAAYVEAAWETLQVALAYPVVPEMVRHGANAVAAVATGVAEDSRAGKHKSRGPLGGGGAGGSGGGGSFGAGAPGGASGGGGGGPQSITINIPGVYTTERGLQAALVGALGDAADAGYQIPGRAIPERRR